MDFYEALEKLVSLAKPPNKEIIPLRNAFGRITASSVFSRHPNPPFTCSKWDGFALNSKLTEGASPENPVVIPIDSTVKIFAGMKERIKPRVNCCYSITSGAVLPEGLDAVIKLEEVEIKNGTIIIKHPIASLDGLWLEGSFWEKDKELLKPFTKLSSVSVFFLAEAGIDQVEVFKKPKIAIIAIGDELVEPGIPLRFGVRYGGIQYLLGSIGESLVMEVINLGIIPDNVSSLTSSFLEASEADLIVTVGGTGQGEKDLVETSWEKLGASLVFRDINLIPGKSAKGGLFKEKIWLALPGGFMGATVIFMEFLDRLFKRWFYYSPIPGYEANLNSDIFKKEGFYVGIFGKIEFAKGLVLFHPLIDKKGNALYEINGYTVVEPRVDKVLRNSVCYVKTFQ